MQPTEEEDEIVGFYADIPSDIFPSDFITAHDRYNLIVKIYGTSVEDEYTTRLGYTANHFCYMTGTSPDGITDTLYYMCYDALDREASIYHNTTLSISMGDTYRLYYEGKSGY